MAQPFTNPYEDTPTMAQVYAEGYAHGRTNQSLHDDTLAVLDMAPAVGSLDALKWVGVVPEGYVLRRQVKDGLQVKTNTGTQWTTQSVRGEDGRSITNMAWDDALAGAKRFAQTSREVRIIHWSDTHVERVIATISDGEILTHYGEHEDYT